MSCVRLVSYANKVLKKKRKKKTYAEKILRDKTFKVI